MNNVDLSPLPKKQKNCFNFSLSVFTGLLLSALMPFCFDDHRAQAADTATPPEAGEQTQDSEAVTPPPGLPEEADDSRNIPQPEVNIIHREDMRIEEYRINGRLRYVKITPKKGKPYYLVDRDGDGELETRHNDLDGMPPVNEWILLEW